MNDKNPKCGEVWKIRLGENEAEGGEANVIEALIVSADQFNEIPNTGTVIIVPVFSSGFGSPTQIYLDGAGLQVQDDLYAHCEKVRSIKTSRLIEYLGMVSSDTREKVSRALGNLLNVKQQPSGKGWGCGGFGY